MKELNDLPPAPTPLSARADLYKVATITLVAIIISGLLASLIGLFFYWPLIRVSLTITLLAALFHIGQAIITSHIPKS